MKGLSMQYKMPIYSIPFRLIKEGKRKVDMRLLDEKRQKLKLNDIIEFIDSRTNESLFCKVKGLLVFNSFDELIDTIPLEMFGTYKDKDEIKLRIRRLYAHQDVENYQVVGIFIELLDVDVLEKDRGSKYLSLGDELVRFNFLTGYRDER
ncbi:MAG: hypothetical protein ACI4OW_03040 [Alphaproteobacteria bacterium]